MRDCLKIIRWKINERGEREGDGEKEGEGDGERESIQLRNDRPEAHI